MIKSTTEQITNCFQYEFYFYLYKFIYSRAEIKTTSLSQQFFGQVSNRYLKWFEFWSSFTKTCKELDQQSLTMNKYICISDILTAYISIESTAIPPPPISHFTIIIEIYLFKKEGPPPQLFNTNHFSIRIRGRGMKMNLGIVAKQLLFRQPKFNLLLRINSFSFCDKQF